MSTEIGRVLGSRYRLIAPIGMGASAQVFLADDTQLGRQVAVKMLHEALADDADFIHRFRAEAKSAAQLSHPNIVAVYDWRDDEVAYIVTEFLAGGSLRALLDEGGRLTPGQALLVGLEAARALDFAHRRNVVHRDIKPANLLFGEEGRLRVADFGLARALAEAAWTEPQGAVLGTARYASPELATGERLTGKADVYALALVLIEAVTGSVPFTADTTLGTLMARVNRPLEVPATLGPLRRVLERAGVADPAERIDARTMAGGLLAAAQGLGRPDPLPLAGAFPRHGVQAVDDAPTLHGSVHDEEGDGPVVVDLRDDDLDLEPPDWVSAAEPALAFRAEGPSAGRDASIDLTRSAVAAPRVAPPPDPPTAGGRATRRRRRWPWVALMVLLLAGGSAGAYALVDRVTDSGPTYRVPDLSGRSPAAARQAVARYRWTVTTAHGRQDGSTPGEVIRTDPAAGTSLRRSGMLQLVVSDGNTLATIPSDITGQRAVDVEARLTRLGLAPNLTRRFDEQVAKGTVIGLVAGTPRQLAKQSTVGLLVSNGPQPRTVPGGLRGAPAATARNRLAAHRLEAKLAPRYDEVVPPGKVIATEPTAGAKAARDSTVTVAVSRGPEPRTVPVGLTGASETAARTVLTGLKLVVATSRRDYSDTVPAGRVISVSPPAGTRLARGAKVALVVSRGPNLVTVPSLSGVTSIEGAIAQLRRSGLVAGNVSGPAAGRPRSTNPAAGARIPRGSTVNIFLG